MATWVCPLCHHDGESLADDIDSLTEAVARLRMSISKAIAFADDHIRDELADELKRILKGGE